MTTAAQHLNWVDYVILGIIGFSILVSFFRGLIREAISLISWLLGLFAALKYAKVLQPLLSSWISSEGIRYFITFTIIFLIVIIVGMVVNAFVRQAVSKSGFSFADRCLGILFGAARGFAVVAIMLLLLTNLGSDTDAYKLTQSKLAIRFKPMVSWLDRYLPDEVKDVSQWGGGKSSSAQSEKLTISKN